MAQNNMFLKVFQIIYKVLQPRGRVQTKWTNEGERGAQMTTTLNNSYLVKLSTWGGEGQNFPKFCPRGLYTPPNMYKFVCKVTR